VISSYIPGTLNRPGDLCDKPTPGSKIGSSAGKLNPREREKKETSKAPMPFNKKSKGIISLDFHPFLFKKAKRN